MEDLVLAHSASNQAVFVAPTAGRFSAGGVYAVLVRRDGVLTQSLEFSVLLFRCFDGPHLSWRCIHTNVHSASLSCFPPPNLDCGLRFLSGAVYARRCADVVQHPSPRAKYLGAFLYAGGYCILAKVSKGGRVYQPRHWFSLSTVEVVDAKEDDGT